MELRDIALRVGVFVAIVLVAALITGVGALPNAGGQTNQSTPLTVDSHQPETILATPPAERGDVAVDSTTTDKTIVIDQSHNNSVSPDAISPLVQRLVAAGHSIQFYTDAIARNHSLNTTLRDADAFVVVAPEEQYGPDERQQVGVIYQLSTKWIYILTFPVFLTLLLIPERVIGLIFGSSYLEGSLALSILSVGFFARVAAGRNRGALTALGCTNCVLVSNVAGIVANVVLNLLLIPRYGVVGAAVASALSFGVLNVIASTLLQMRYDINPITSHNLRTFVGLPIFLIPVGMVGRQFVPENWVGVTVFFPAATVSTVVLVLLLGSLQTEDDLIVSAVEDILGISIPYVRWFID